MKILTQTVHNLSGVHVNVGFTLFYIYLAKQALTRLKRIKMMNFKPGTNCTVKSELVKEKVVAPHSSHVDKFTFHVSFPSLKFAIFIHLSH